MDNPTIEMVPLEKIKCAKFNPASRTEKRALVKLRQAIEEAGAILVPILISKDGTIADGHRRYTVAKELGFETVPVIRINMPVEKIWGNVNAPIMAPTSKTWMEAVNAGLALSVVPDKERNAITELKRLMGERGFAKLAEAGRSTYILTMAQSVARYVGDESDRTVKAIILWFEECQQQFAVRSAMREKMPPELLLEAIQANRPIRKFWGVA